MEAEAKDEEKVQWKFFLSSEWKEASKERVERGEEERMERIREGTPCDGNLFLSLERGRQERQRVTYSLDETISCSR